MQSIQKEVKICHNYYNKICHRFTKSKKAVEKNACVQKKCEMWTKEKWKKKAINNAKLYYVLNM